MMRKSQLNLYAILLMGVFLRIASVWADTIPLDYKAFHFGYFPQSEWIIPQTIGSDRLYIRSKFFKYTYVTNTQLLLDGQTLLHPIGNDRTTSIPSELAQGYRRTYSDIEVFSLAAVKQAKKQIELGWTLENGHQKKQLITGKQLQILLNSFPAN
jgi:hypothetical protein